jgi:hypothetical protein
MASTPDRFAVVFEPVPPGSRWQVLLETTQRTVSRVLVDHDDLDVVHDPENIKPLKRAVCSRASQLASQGQAVVLGDTASSTEVLSWDLDASTAARRAVELHSTDLTPAAATDRAPSAEPAATEGSEPPAYRIVDDLDSPAAEDVRVLLAGLQADACPDGTWDPDRAIPRVMAFFVRHGFDLVADTTSSASRQHYIKTRRFLPHKEEQ